jgi:peptide/nickel transport system ATP-binding protein
MYLGRIVELAPTEALFDAPLHPYTQALLAATPVSTPHARRPRALLQGDVPSPAAPPPGCHFHTRCPHARPLCREQVPALLQADGRAVACHFWREITGVGASPIATPSAVFQRRLAIFATQLLAMHAAPK